MTRVVVVGAGPVGLALAGDLGRRGVDVVVIEKRPAETDKHPTANHIGVRVMEVLRRWGLADEVRLETFDPGYGDTRYWLTSVGGEVLHQIDRPANGAEHSLPQSPEREARSPKHDFDPILERFAARHGAELRHEHELLGVDDRADGVVASVATPEGDRSIEADWLVGCDGANSIVRALAGIDLSIDLELPVTLQSTYFRSRALIDRLPPGGTQYSLGSIGGGIMVAIDGCERWRVHVPSFDDQPWTTEAMTNHLGGLLGDVDVKILSVIPWRLRSCLTSSWRRGRVVLAGDSAHQVSPYGGLGMNYGVLDAEALGWRLASFDAGWGADGLLDGYEHERAQSVRGLLRYQGVDLDAEPPTMSTKMLWPPVAEDIDDDSPSAFLARRELGRALAESNIGHFDNPGVDLDQRHPDSPGVVPDGSPEPDWSVTSYRQDARPGHRAPHRWIAHGRSTLDLVGDGFVLFTPGGDDPTGLRAAAHEVGLPLRVEAADLSGGAAVLVRPDGVVGWRGPLTPVDQPDRIIDAMAGR